MLPYLLIRLGALGLDNRGLVALALLARLGVAATAVATAPAATAATATATARRVALRLAAVEKELCAELGAVNVKVARLVLADAFPLHGAAANRNTLGLNFTQLVVRNGLAEADDALRRVPRELDTRRRVQRIECVLSLIHI